MCRKAAFIDRDRVVNVEATYVHRIEDFVFLSGAIETLRQLQEPGYLPVIVTNPSALHAVCTRRPIIISSRGNLEAGYYRAVVAPKVPKLARS